MERPDQVLAASALGEMGLRFPSVPPRGRETGEADSASHLLAQRLGQRDAVTYPAPPISGNRAPGVEPLYPAGVATDLDHGLGEHCECGCVRFPLGANYELSPARAIPAGVTDWNRGSPSPAEPARQGCCTEGFAPAARTGNAERGDEGLAVVAEEVSERSCGGAQRSSRPGLDPTKHTKWGSDQGQKFLAERPKPVNHPGIRPLQDGPETPKKAMEFARPARYLLALPWRCSSVGRARES